MELQGCSFKGTGQPAPGLQLYRWLVTLHAVVSLTSLLHSQLPTGHLLNQQMNVSLYFTAWKHSPDCLILKNEARLILNMQNLFMIVGISIHTSGSW